jgi:hypothetical protein
MTAPEGAASGPLTATGSGAIPTSDPHAVPTPSPERRGDRKGRPARRREEREKSPGLAGYIGTQLSKAQELADEMIGEGAVSASEGVDGDIVVLAGPYSEDLRRARELEATALLHMEIQGSRHTGFVSAIKVVP